MIAIPNMDKPKDCWECVDNFDIECCGDIRNCPLIEIVECCECEYYNGNKEYCDNDYFAKEHGFCFYGKRKKDEL